MTMTGRQTLTLMLAASFASTIGGLPFNSLPILLGALTDSFGFSAQQAGFLGSACFAGFFLGTLAAVFVVDRVSWRLLTVFAAVAASAALLLSSRLPAAAQLPLWALIGFFAALMTCLGLRIMGEMANKERALGLRQGIELSITALVLFILPAFVIAQYQYTGAAITLSLIILLLSLSALVLPRRSRVTAQAPQLSLAQQLKLPAIAWGGLFVFFLFLVGQIGLWAFLERMGRALELQPAELGTVFAVLKLLGGAAALVIAIVGDRLGLRLPQLVVFGVICIGLLLLYRADGFLSYAFGAWVWEVGFTWGCVFQTAMIARLDPRGRAIMLIPAAFAASSMVGPALAGNLVAGGFESLLLLALVSAAVGAAVFGLYLGRRAIQDAPQQTVAAVPAAELS
ncbi:MFS transporter [Marinobacterium rhizophilum]|uniref:MFS transporter n=1 Tax=Marinobacterium rhizophilum TaxID=420402 RepID=A0ABY5HIU7_9GAMM|nr:MFS transporter [Marinobacterium rhizophilum]UTW12298.1 MFS transporter [Marinobacterium rhizophilum]